MIQLGTVVPIGFGDFDPLEWLDLYRQLGCKVVQAYRNTGPDAHVTAQQMRDAIDAGGLPCDSLHAPFSERYDPSAPDERARRMAVDALKREAELCRELGGDIVVVHGSARCDGGVTDDERCRRHAQFARSAAELAGHGAACGVRYAFENLPPYHPLHGVDELAAALDALAHPCAAMCFDTAHASMREPVVPALRRAGRRIIYTHMSDCDTLRDSHDLPGLGGIDFGGVCVALRDIGFAGTFMLECFYSTSRLRQLVEAGYAERLRDLLIIANGASAAPGA